MCCDILWDCAVSQREGFTKVGDLQGLEVPDLEAICKELASKELAREQQAGPTCQSCGQNQASGYKFCTGCGTKAAATMPAPTSPTCPNCGEMQVLGYKFCTGCGTKAAATTMRNGAGTFGAGNRLPETPLEEFLVEAQVRIVVPVRSRAARDSGV